MKTINYKLLLILLISFIFMQESKAQCVASFTYVDNGNGNFSFTNTSGSGLDYYWNFDNSSQWYTSTIENPTYAYSTPGTYWVSLSIYDSLNGCQDSIAQQIVTTCNITASFTYTDNGNGNYSFTNTSTGTNLNYYIWDFDGNGFNYNENVENKDYTFTANGTYQVCIQVGDTDLGCYDNSCQNITVTSVPNLCAGFNVSFLATLNSNYNNYYNFSPTVTGGTAPLTYSWDYGDGTTSNYYNYHPYNQEGTYYPELTVTDSNGCSANDIDTLILNKCNYWISNYQQYTNQYAFSTNARLNITTAVWDFGDGNTTTGGFNVTHIYSNPGTYYYCLTIDSCPPVCDSLVVDVCSYNTYAYVDSLSVVHFQSNDSPTSTSSYFWDFGDGNTSTQAYPNHSYSAPGTYYYCLTIDSCPSVCDSVVVIGCNINAYFGINNLGNGNYAFYNYSSGSALNGLSAYWNFGDGNTSTTYSPNHIYNTNGTYVVVLIAMDSTIYGACMGYYTTTITVTDAINPVVCNAAFVMFPDSSSTTNFIVVNSSTGSNLSYFWDFGDGNTSTQAYPNYTYSTAGPFELCLTVTGDSSCTSTYCDSISDGGIILKQGGFTINVISPSSTLSVNDNEEAVTELNIYPNPAKELLNIEMDLVKNATIELFVTDIAGKIIAQIANNKNQVGKQKYQWNVGGLQNGVYLLNIKSDNNIQVKKIMVNR